MNVTTLPMMYAAYPLYELGGDRASSCSRCSAAMLRAGRARTRRRLGARTGWTAFWVIGLVGPVAIYALDFWEHSLGLALMLWGVVWLLRRARRRTSSASTAFVAGALFGAAASMRTEALVYLVVCAGVACFVQLWRTRRLGGVLGAGFSVLAGAGVVWVANGVLERVALGGTIRGAPCRGNRRRRAVVRECPSPGGTHDATLGSIDSSRPPTGCSAA